MPLLNEHDRNRLHDRYTDPRFRAAVANLKATAACEMQHPLAVPAEGAGWLHNYTCPVHATRLHHDRDQPHTHICEVDGAVFSGGVYDAAWRCLRNNQLIASAHAAAVLWAMSAEAAYRDHAAAVLGAYAERYPDYPVHGIYAGYGRLMGQSLDEAVWAIPAAWTFDLIRDALPVDDESYIRERLLHGLGDHLLTQIWPRIHNIQCWHLAGLATLGAALDEPRYIDPAFDPQWGLAAQIKWGTRADGWWWEGSPLYHFYTAQAITALLAALRYRHPELLDHPALKRMFAAPLALLRPDLSLPAMNDGWFDSTPAGGIAQYAGVFERVHGFWGLDIHAQILAHIYADDCQRDTADSLLFGPDTLPAPESLPFRSVVQVTSGYAVLKTHDNQRHVLLKYGPHGGWHGHPDKLALILWAHGERLSPDLGTPGYGIDMLGTWYRHTLAHNTVLIDEQSQPEQTGLLLRFDDRREHATVHVGVDFPDDADTPYAGVEIRRMIWCSADYFVDLVTVNCQHPKTIDLAWHHTGALTFDGLTPTDITWTKAGYVHLHNIRTTAAEQWRAEWRTASGPGSVMWAANPPGTQTIVSDAPYNPASETMSLILRRVHAAHAVFVSVVAPFADQPGVTGVEWSGDTDPVRFTVYRSGGADVWQIDPQTGDEWVQ